MVLAIAPPVVSPPWAHTSGEGCRGGQPSHRLVRGGNQAAQASQNRAQSRVKRQKQDPRDDERLSGSPHPRAERRPSSIGPTTSPEEAGKQPVRAWRIGWCVVRQLRRVGSICLLCLSQQAVQVRVNGRQRTGSSRRTSGRCRRRRIQQERWRAQSLRRGASVEFVQVGITQARIMAHETRRAYTVAPSSDRRFLPRCSRNAVRNAVPWPLIPGPVP